MQEVGADDGLGRTRRRAHDHWWLGVHGPGDACPDRADCGADHVDRVSTAPARPEPATDEHVPARRARPSPRQRRDHQRPIRRASQEARRERIWPTCSATRSNPRLRHAPPSPGPPRAALPPGRPILRRTASSTPLARSRTSSSAGKPRLRLIRARRDKVHRGAVRLALIALALNLAPAEMLEGTQDAVEGEPVAVRAGAAPEAAKTCRSTVLVTVQLVAKPHVDLVSHLAVHEWPALGLAALQLRRIIVMGPHVQAGRAPGDEIDQPDRLDHVVENPSAPANVELIPCRIEVADRLAAEEGAALEREQLLGDQALQVGVLVRLYRNNLAGAGSLEHVAVPTLERTQLEAARTADATQRLDRPINAVVLKQLRLPCPHPGQRKARCPAAGDQVDRRLRRGRARCEGPIGIPLGADERAQQRADGGRAGQSHARQSTAHGPRPSTGETVGRSRSEEAQHPIAAKPPQSRPTGGPLAAVLCSPPPDVAPLASYREPTSQPLLTVC